MTSSTKAKVLSGIELSEVMRAEIGEQAAAFTGRTGVVPGLAVVLVGDDPASEVYVRMKGKAADKAGFHSQQFTLPGNTTEAHLLGIIDDLNRDAKIPAELDVRAFVLVRETLAYVMQNSHALGHHYIETHLGRHVAGHDGDFLGVHELVLSVAGAEFQTAQNLDDFRMHAVHTQLVENLFR